MNNGLIGDLRDCSKFRQTLLARPPAVVHGTAILLVMLLISAVVWSSLTRANLVVRAPGRVRPENRIFRVFVPESVETSGYSVGAQVQEVLYREGDTVRKGEVLLRLDTRLTNEEMAKLELTIQTCKAELARLGDRADLLSQRFDIARLKAEVELLQAEEEIRQARQTRAIEMRRAEAEHRQALLQQQRFEKLQAKTVVTDTEVEEAQLKVKQALANLKLAQQPINDRKVEIRRRGVELVKKDYALQAKELESEQTRKQSEYQRANKELAVLERERQRAVLRSPIDGIVTTKEVRVGDILHRGEPAIEIAKQGVLHFEATVSSKEASHLRRGMPVRVKLDAYDHQWYGTLPANVEFISPDSRVGGEGQGSHVGYEVRIAFERHELRRGDLRAQVKLGLTGTAEIITDRKSILSILTKSIRRSISWG